MEVAVADFSYYPQDLSRVIKETAKCYRSIAVTWVEI